MSRIVVKRPRELQKEVLNKGLCSACGACVNLYPYIDMVAGRAVMIEPCSLSEGKCYEFCPRTRARGRLHYIVVNYVFHSFGQIIFGGKASHH